MGCHSEKIPGCSHKGGPCQDENDAHPVVQVQGTPQDDYGQQASKHHHRAPQHLKY